MDSIPKPEENKVEVPSTLSSVNIRTMESDLESMKTTGGTHPVAQVVDTAPVFENEAPLSEKEEGSEHAPIPNQKTTWGWFYLGLLFIILFAVGYFILPLFL